MKKQQFLKDVKLIYCLLRGLGISQLKGLGQRHHVIACFTVFMQMAKAALPLGAALARYSWKHIIL